MKTFSYTTLFIVGLLTSARAQLVKQEYPWYPYYTALEYYTRYCDRGCHGPLSYVEYWDPTCFPCSCSDSCKIYGTCCPSFEPQWAQSIFDAVDEYNKTVDTSDTDSENSRLLQNFEKFSCVSDIPNNPPFLAVNSCPSSEKNATLHDLCTKNLMDTVKSYTPVSMNETGVVYRNDYCRQCNEAENEATGGKNDDDYYKRLVDHNSKNWDPNNSGGTFVPWKLIIECIHYQTMYHITSEDEFLRQAFLEEARSICTVILEYPDGVPKSDWCIPSWYIVDSYDYSLCIVSDPRIRNYCLHIKHPAFRTTFRGHNLFCMLCEGETPSKVSGTYPTIIPPATSTTMASSPAATWHTTTAGPIGRVSPLSLLLGITNKLTSNALPECSNITWRNEKDECEAALCSAGKEADSNGTCASVLQQIRGLGYKLSMVLTVDQEDVVVTQDDVRYLMEQVYDQIKNISSESDIQINITVNYDSEDEGGQEILHNLAFTSHIIADDKITRDEFEARTLETVTDKWTLYLSEASVSNVTFSGKMLGVEFSGQHSQYLETFLRNVHEYTPYTYDYDYNYIYNYNYFITSPPRTTTTTFPSTPGFYDDLKGETKKSNRSSEVGKLVMKQYRFSGKPLTIPHYQLWSLKEDFIDITHSLVCPYVGLNVTSMAIDIGKAIVTFAYSQWNVNVTSASNISLVNEELRVCVDLFKSLTRGLRRIKYDPLEIARGYFEIVCFSLSVVCLLVSFLTYCLFPTLRSLPGLNNMSLCLSLATAHTSLLVTVQHGYYGDLTSGYCTFHAILLHYFWLAAIFWMSACCIHMYRVFTCPNAKFTNSDSADKKRFLRYAGYAFGTPCLIVVLTFGINLGVTSGESNGYDDSLCFFDLRSILTVVLSLIVPLCLMIFSNLVLFFLTVREIVHVSNLQQDRRSRERHGVIAYAKLSTLTGIFCIVCVVVEQFPNPILKFFSSPFITLQGVFIFFSFIVNKRVKKLYSDLLASKGISLPWSQSSSGTDNLRTTSSESGRQTEPCAKSTTESTRI